MANKRNIANKIKNSNGNLSAFSFFMTLPHLHGIFSFTFLLVLHLHVLMLKFYFILIKLLEFII